MQKFLNAAFYTTFGASLVFLVMFVHGIYTMSTVEQMYCKTGFDSGATCKAALILEQISK